MNPAPKVSIIVPNYNYVRYLEERFRSILGQTFGDYEIIFLDDASTDGSLKLVDENFKASLTRTEVNAKNSGNPFVQWNRGVKLSRGEYVWIAEADDVCTHEFLERLVQILDANPAVGLAYCNTIPINENGTILDANFHHRYV
jgi:glycosyltransferase involved in cell wall biosynthesis